GMEAKDQERVVDSIRLSLGAQAQGAQIKLVEARQFVSRIKGQYPDLARELDELGPEMETVIPRYVSVSGILSDGAVEKVKGVSGVDSVESSKDRNRRVLGAFLALKWLARMLGAGICLALLTGLIHLSRMNAYLHSDAISLLKLWG